MNSKKNLVLSIVAVATLFIALIGATFAYFNAAGSTSTSASVNVTTYTSDVLTFQVGDPINIETNQTLFASGKGNAVGTTFAKTTLIANNKTNTATKNYYLYLNISSNTFTYTQNTNTPEILMTITNGSGTAVTSIDGLTHKTVTDGKGVSVSGFDITNKTGLVPLFTNRSITTTSSIEEKWNITITLINYNADQSANAGKNFSAKLIVQKDAYEGEQTTLADYIKSQYTGTQGDNGIYLHKQLKTV